MGCLQLLPEQSNPTTRAPEIGISIKGRGRPKMPLPGHPLPVPPPRGSGIATLSVSQIWRGNTSQTRATYGRTGFFPPAPVWSSTRPAVSTTRPRDRSSPGSSISCRQGNQRGHPCNGVDGVTRPRLYPGESIPDPAKSPCRTDAFRSCVNHEGTAPTICG